MFSKENPFKASIKERLLLSGKGSTKETWHLVLNLEGSGLSYQVGDSLGVFSENEPALVERTLQALSLTGDEIVQDKRSLEEMTLREFFTKKASITHFSRKFLNEVLLRAGETPQIAPENPKELLEKHHLWDFMSTFKGVYFTAQEVAQLMMPLLPRFYSIASSLQVNPNEVHLTVAHLKYSTNQEERLGVCTHYLCKLAPLNENVVPIFIYPTESFKLPEDPAVDVIMVGPGTGVAPFRAFMQEREALQAPGKNWLFFGERSQTADFYYEEEWRRMEQKGRLILDVAFSRDQPEKIYVQHKMLEKGAELMAWLERGAVVYVCGDAARMAKDVDHALHKIVETHSGHDPIEYMKNLRKSKRYLRDVY